jgi:hypothetical protein
MISIFPLWTFHLYVATIPAAPAYGQTDRQHNGQIKKGQKDKQHSTKTISQLIWYSRACDSYQTKNLATRTPLKQGWTQVLRKGKPFLLHQWHPSLSSYKPGEWEERTGKCLRQVEHINGPRACDSYQDLLDKSVAAYKEATETRVPIG